MNLVRIDRLNDQASLVRSSNRRVLLDGILACLLLNLVIDPLEVLGELLFGNLFAWRRHRTSPVLVHPSVPGRDPWPTARPALLSAAGRMRLHPHSLYDLRRRSLAGHDPASAHPDQHYSESASAVQHKPFRPNRQRGPSNTRSERERGEINPPGTLATYTILVYNWCGRAGVSSARYVSFAVGRGRAPLSRGCPSPSRSAQFLSLRHFGGVCDVIGQLIQEPRSRAGS